MIEHPEDQPNTPEIKAEKAHVIAAREVIARAGENAPETDARFDVVDSYVKRLLLAADAGKITGSEGTYSRDQLLDRVSVLLSELSQPEDQRRVSDPYTVFPSKDGMRRSVRLLMEDDATHGDFELSLRLQLEARDRQQAEAKAKQQDKEEAELITGVPESLGFRAKAEEDLGEEAVEASGVVDPDASQAASRIVSLGEASKPVEAREETEAEMYARFERERRGELQELYRQYGQVDSRSAEADALQNQINQAKEDIGEYGKKRRKLQGM